MRTTPYRRQANEEDIAPWQEDGTVGRFGCWYILSGHAPMLAVHIRGWYRQDGYWRHVGAVESA